MPSNFVYSTIIGAYIRAFTQFTTLVLIIGPKYKIFLPLYLGTAAKAIISLSHFRGMQCMILFLNVIHFNSIQFKLYFAV